MIVILLWFGYFLGIPFFLTDYSILFPCGIFVTIGLLAIYLEYIEQTLQQALLKDYGYVAKGDEDAPSSTFVVSGTILDRRAVQHSSSKYNDIESSYLVYDSTTLVTTAYHIQVEYRIPVPSALMMIQQQPQQPEQQCSISDSTTQQQEKEPYDYYYEAVVHRSYTVSRDIYYGLNFPIEVVVLDPHQHGLLSGMLHYKLKEQQEKDRSRCCCYTTRCCIGIGLLLMGVSVPILLFVSEQQSFTKWDWLALALHLIITVVALVFVHRNAVQKQHHIRMGTDGSAKLHALVKKPSSTATTTAVLTPPPKL